MVVKKTNNIMASGHGQRLAHSVYSKSDVLCSERHGLVCKERLGYVYVQ